MSDSDRLQPLISDLSVVLERLASLHEEMVDLIQEKLRAMRGNRVDALRDASEGEHRLVQEIAGLRHRQHRIVDLAGRKLGMSTQRARTTPVQQWAQHCREPLASRLAQAGSRLRRSAGEISRLNHIVGRASSLTIEHLAAVMTPAVVGPLKTVYDKGGERDSIFNAIY